MPNAGLTVTNNSDLNDSREINFEYLKHVVLKFMSCRESEVKNEALHDAAFAITLSPLFTMSVRSSTKSLGLFFK